LASAYRLLAIGLGVLDDLASASARFRDDLVGVGLRLVLRAFEVGARRPARRGKASITCDGRIDLLQLHLRDLNAGAVFVENGLHQILHAGFDVLRAPVRIG
jgi:hypothetical protein